MTSNSGSAVATAAAHSKSSVKAFLAPTELKKCKILFVRPSVRRIVRFLYYKGYEGCYKGAVRVKNGQEGSRRFKQVQAGSRKF